MKALIVSRYICVAAQMAIVIALDRVGAVNGFWLMTALTLIVYATFILDKKCKRGLKAALQDAWLDGLIAAL